MESIFAFVLLILIILLVLELRFRSNKMPDEERMANTTRILTNLIPITLLLITNAEYMYGGKTGPFKRSYVMDELYRRIPDEYKKYINEENLDILINNVLPKAEGLWVDNPQLIGRS